jgi:hypothetical protein
MSSIRADAHVPHGRTSMRGLRTLLIAVALVLVIGGGVAFATVTLLSDDPLTGPAAPPENDAALRNLFPPYQIGHAKQLAAYDGRKLFGARTGTGGYCFSATSPIDPKGEGGHCVTPSEARTLDTGATVAFAMSGGSVGGYAPGASHVRVSGAGIDVTVPVSATGWWLGVAQLPAKPPPHFRGPFDVVATSLSADGQVLGRDPLMRVSVLRPGRGWVLGIAFN